MIGPIFEELSNDAKYASLVFIKVDVDANAETAGKCGISAMPTFHAYKNGAKIKELVGASKDGLVALLDAVL